MPNAKLCSGDIKSVLQQHVRVVHSDSTRVGRLRLVGRAVRQTYCVMVPGPVGGARRAIRRVLTSNTPAALTPGETAPNYPKLPRTADSNDSVCRAPNGAGVVGAIRARATLRLHDGVSCSLELAWQIKNKNSPKIRRRYGTQRAARPIIYATGVVW
mgnify:CR=1 FL=1